ncbi:hypothetical protein NCCP2716_27350 [Sporosarcina sp. NCCP-2716]|nr:hypothetical protein NCCP2716_27350 [Sporosarcina sp. NCCP-2716]
MLSDLNKIQLLLITIPWAALYITWLYMYCNYEERKTARKEQSNG